eukprot:6190943-Pleurochrysis_carterae.AAC.2
MHHACCSASREGSTLLRKLWGLFLSAAGAQFLVIFLWLLMATKLLRLRRPHQLTRVLTRHII